MTFQKRIRFENCHFAIELDLSRCYFIEFLVYFVTHDNKTKIHRIPDKYANYTCTNLSDHLDNVSHDVVSNFLKQERITPRQVWNLVKSLINNTEESCLIMDDSVQNKQYSKSIELVKKQYSGAVGGLVRGIGIVNRVHTDGKAHYPIDYRIYASEADGKTKNDHFKEMLHMRLRSSGLRQKRYCLIVGMLLGIT